MVRRYREDLTNVFTLRRRLRQLNFPHHVKIRRRVGKKHLIALERGTEHALDAIKWREKPG
jgi:hypothetical protein